jgi:hypothetical protein
MTASPIEAHLGLVIEGRGELEAVPILLRKLLLREGVHKDIIGKPVQCLGRDNALKEGGLEGRVAIAAARPGCRAVLVILDGEGDPVCELGPQLATRAEVGARGKPTAVCLADEKYEDWLIASAETLGLENLTYKPGRGAISLLIDALKPAKYIKPTWQPRLTHALELDLAVERSQSLRRFCARVIRLCQEAGFIEA